MTILDIIDSGGLIAFAGLIYIELRELRKAVSHKLEKTEKKLDLVIERQRVVYENVQPPEPVVVVKEVYGANS